MKKIIHLLSLIASFYINEVHSIVIQEEINSELLSFYDIKYPFSYTPFLTDNDTIFLLCYHSIITLTDSLDVIKFNNHKASNSYSYNKINNNNMLLGIDQYERIPIIWTPENGIYYLYLREHIANSTSAALVDLNSNNTILGSYFVKGNNSDKKIFLYRDGKVWNLDDDDDDFKKFGPYKSVEPISINDSEAIFGHITFKQRNDYESSFFIKDENGFRLVNLPLPQYAKIVGINNKNQVLIKNPFVSMPFHMDFQTDQVMVWDEENGLKVVANNIIPTSINDRGQILGTSTSNKSYYHKVLIQDGKVTNLTEFLRSERPDLSIDYGNINMNNNGILLVKMVTKTGIDSVLLKINTNE